MWNISRFCIYRISESKCFSSTSVYLVCGNSLFRGKGFFTTEFPTRTVRFPEKTESLCPIFPLLVHASITGKSKNVFRFTVLFSNFPASTVLNFCHIPFFINVAGKDVDINVCCCLSGEYVDRRRHTARGLACAVYPNAIGDPRSSVLVCVHHCHNIIAAGQYWDLITPISRDGNWHGNWCVEIRRVGERQNSVLNGVSIPPYVSRDIALFYVCFDAGRCRVQMSIRVVAGTYHELNVKVFSVSKCDRSRGLCCNVHCSVST